MERATADDIFEKFKECFGEKQILSNLVGVATDDANVMLGDKNSFVQKVKTIKPRIFSAHCLSHIGNLIAQKAQKSIPQSVLTLLTKAYAYFSRSSSRNEEFLKLQKSIKPLSLLTPNPTR